jgi:hypothetical protein
MLTKLAGTGTALEGIAGDARAPRSHVMAIHVGFRSPPATILPGFTDDIAPVQLAPASIS